MAIPCTLRRPIPKSIVSRTVLRLYANCTRRFAWGIRLNMTVVHVKKEKGWWYTEVLKILKIWRLSLSQTHLFHHFFPFGYRASPLFCKQHAGTMTDDSSKHDTSLGEVDIPRADALLQGKLSLGIETPIDKRSAVNIHSVALSVSK